MSADEQHLAPLVFDTIAKAQLASTVVELEEVFGRSFAAWGVDYYVALRVVDPHQAPRVELEAGRSHPEWEARYQAAGHAARDPIVREMLRSPEPMFWSDLPVRRGELGPEERLVLEEARSFGLNEGFATPVHHRDGSVSAVWLMGRRLPVTPHARPAMHLASLYYGHLVRKLSRTGPSSAASKVKLTRRQLQCLDWVRKGKSSYAIGQFLGISPRTVDEHLSCASKKLGVGSRHEAARLAERLGLFD